MVIIRCLLCFACCSAALQSQTLTDPCKAEKVEVAKLKQWVDYDRQEKNRRSNTTRPNSRLRTEHSSSAKHIKLRKRHQPRRTQRLISESPT
jgi:hypothetical protein